MAQETKYPECEKLAVVGDKSQAIGAFLEWLISEKDVELAKWGEGDDPSRHSEGEVLCPMPYTIESLLAEYFEIDMEKVEKERQRMIEDIQKANNPQTGRML